MASAIGLGALAAARPVLGAPMDIETTGFRTLMAGKRTRFGAAIDVADIDRPDMVALYKRHCTSLTPRNALKWMTNEPRPGRIDYRGGDRLVDFARSIDCTLYGHTLIWYRVPGWVNKMTDPKELRVAMRNRVTGAIKHFTGAVYAWDVVTEPMEYTKASLRPSVFQRLLGEDHIRESFDLAHEADPRAQLVLSECHLEKAGAMYDGRRALLLEVIERLAAKGTPIHSVGIQSHFRPGLDRLDPDALARFCRSLKQLGVGVRITELDGSCRFVARLGAVDQDKVYADVFSDVIRVASANGDLQSVSTWGIAEKYTPAEEGAVAPCRGRVLPYDDNMTPRAAFGALADALRALP
jgi:endo-1,4-beta-xylanase